MHAASSSNLLLSCILLFSINTKLKCTDHCRLGQCQILLAAALSKKEKWEKKNVEASLRQRVFWECGLSHVSAQHGFP